MSGYNEVRKSSASTEQIGRSLGYFHLASEQGDMIEV